MKLLILLLSIFILTGCKDKVYEVENSIGFSITEKVSVYDDVYLNDILKLDDNNIIVLSDNYKIDTGELGSKEYELLYKIDNKNYLYKYSITVTDNEAPILFSGTNRTVVKGYDKDLCNLITYGDNYTGDLKCVINGDYDLNKVGTYKLVYSISDSSNNTKDINVTLNVVEKMNNSSNYNVTRIPFEDIYKEYKDSNNEIGLDISEWQGNVDFNKIKESGVSFVILRIGHQSKDGDPFMDGQYLNNIKKAKEAGLKVGVYLYTIAGTKKEAIDQANWVINKLDGEKLELGIAFDWENWQYWNYYKISFHEINEIANTFIDTVNKNGYTGYLYSSKFYLETIWQNKNNYPVWLAHYIDKTDYKGEYKIWQLCNNAVIDGINGFVDVDIMYVDK